MFNPASWIYSIFFFIAFIVLYFFLRKYFLNHTPVLKGKSVGFALFFPLLCLNGAVSSFITAASLPDRDDLGEMLVYYENLQKYGIEMTKEQFDMMYFNAYIGVFLGIVYVCTMTFAIYAMFKRTEHSRKVVMLNVWIPIILSILVSLLFSKENATGHLPKEGGNGFIPILYGVIIPILIYGIIGFFFNKSVKRIYEYAGTFDTPFPFTSSSEKQTEKKDMAEQPVVQETKSRTELLLDLKSLLDAGILSQEEFDAQKKEILNS